jgi:hypothetical protein
VFALIFPVILFDLILAAVILGKLLGSGSK